MPKYWNAGRDPKSARHTETARRGTGIDATPPSVAVEMSNTWDVFHSVKAGHLIGRVWSGISG